MLNLMSDMLNKFYDDRGLENLCAFESQMVGNYHTEKDLEWLERFSDVWERVQDRDYKKWEAAQCSD